MRLGNYLCPEIICRGIWPLLELSADDGGRELVRKNVTVYSRVRVYVVARHSGTYSLSISALEVSLHNVH